MAWQREGEGGIIKEKNNSFVGVEEFIFATSPIYYYLYVEDKIMMLLILDCSSPKLNKFSA